MGFFDKLFGSSGGNSEENWAKKQVRRLTNKYGQKEIREDAMYSLYQRGTPEAIYGLLQRFTFNHPESIVDEREKNKIIELLDALGPEKASEPLRKFLADGKQPDVSMALIALETLEGETATLVEIVQLLQAADPNDAWGSDRKLQLIGHLDELETEQIPTELIEVLVKFLGDLDDDVIFRCIALLERYGTDDQIRTAFVNQMLLEETSMRIRSRILDTVRERKWYVGEHRAELEALLPEGYYFDKRNNLKYKEPTYN